MEWGSPRASTPIPPREPRAGRSQFSRPLGPSAPWLELQTGAVTRVCLCVGDRDVTQRAPAVSGSRREAGVGARETAQGRSARRTHRTLAATEDMASLLSALLREAAAPMVEAAAHPPASERAPRPPPPPGEPRRVQARARDLHGRAGDSARPAAPGAAARTGGDAPPTVASGAGLGGPPVVTPGLGDGSAHRDVRPGP